MLIDKCPPGLQINFGTAKIGDWLALNASNRLIGLSAVPELGGRVIDLSLDEATPNLMILETVRRHYNHRFVPIATATGAPQNGQPAEPPGPGLGVDLREDFLRSGRVQIESVDERSADRSRAAWDRGNRRVPARGHRDFIRNRSLRGYRSGRQLTRYERHEIRIMIEPSGVLINMVG